MAAHGVEIFLDVCQRKCQGPAASADAMASRILWPFAVDLDRLTSLIGSRISKKENIRRCDGWKSNQGSKFDPFVR